MRVLILLVMAAVIYISTLLVPAFRAALPYVVGSLVTAWIVMDVIWDDFSDGG